MVSSEVGPVVGTWRSVTAWRERASCPALVDTKGVLTYGELADRVTERAATWLHADDLLLLPMANDVDSVVSWLAARVSGRPALMAASRDAAAHLHDRFAPSWRVEEGALTRCQAPTRSQIAPHPDLALVLTTSGSTGAMKCVRLSAANLDANAAAIVEALGIRPTDVALLNLPVAHAYGLSVLHSHLQAGAAVWLTDRSVTDPGFRDAFDALGVTTLPGVPYTFDLLDRVDFWATPPTNLRLVTQAGGRLAPDRVRALARTGTDQGWSLVVMYGQTEATARLCFLPPELAQSHPHAVGRPVPGVGLRLEPVDEVEDHDVGEVIASGPGVMMGYAEGRDDLARGHLIDELATGDLGRWTDDGLLQIVGRRARMAKPFGLRVDLERLEQALACAGHVVAVLERPDGLGVLVEGRGEGATVASWVARDTGLPAAALRVVEVDALPRGQSGKVDGTAARALLEADRGAPAPARIDALYAHVFGLTEVRGDDTFLGLGGDSLLFVHVSTELASRLDDVPEDWPSWSVDALQALVPPAGRARVTLDLEAGVWLRAVGILAVTASHVGLLGEGGGAHLLLLLVGHHFARFHLTDAPRAERVQNMVSSLLRWAVPTGAFLAVLALVDPRYDAHLVFTAHFSAPGDGLVWRYWFVETLLYLHLAALGVMVVGDREERRSPFVLPLALTMLAGLLLVLFGGDEPRISNMPLGTAWLFLLGWTAHRADDRVRRGAVLVVITAWSLGMFGPSVRAALVVLGGFALLADLRLPVPRPMGRALSAIAATSLVIYLTQFTVLDALSGRPWWGLVAAVGVGVTLGLGLGALARAVPSLPSRVDPKG